ncbi:MAG: hypothetical protein H0W36_06770, partial [Gemmatimonadetes bacterium]|nr:hypothetical protein [Gemmatimonadota bacterium]
MAIAIVAADPGYLSDNNLALEEELEVELLIATKSRRQTAQNGKPPRGRIPHGLSRTQLMERKWKRAGELERRWAEAEWVRRSKSRGLLPQDCSDEERERFKIAATRNGSGS